ncbi:iron-dependent peroxidase [Lysinibacillus fusiformis]|uniref:iron-dependent peroxidase n=1 Tax=Lysinibacillus fusiformis TaxID=28031 RepID=UPI002EA3EEBB|nr:iron-dependent peroxidase [Lysinibacillus fusiformis]
MVMNYIWDLLIQAEEEGFLTKDIYFHLAKIYSPYMELSPQLLNSQAIEQHVEVNPYYRYFDIFKDLFHPDHTTDEAFRDALLDIILHFLAEIDRMQGLNKKEYYIRFMLRDIEANVFGKLVRDKIKSFSKKEQEIIALNMLRLYQTGEALYLIKDTLKNIFRNCFIYVKSEENDELLLYIHQKKTIENINKVQLIQEIFLPIGFQMEVYWQYHFGIIDVEETMKLDRIALY